MERRKTRKASGILASLSAPKRLALLIAMLQLQLVAWAGSVSTTTDYAGRLQQAGKAINELIEQESQPAEVAGKMAALKRLLPPTEEVEFNGAILRVDNFWLGEMADNVTRNASGDIEQRHSMLREMADRLSQLQRQVAEAQKPPASATGDHRARLESILARPEYQPEEKRESTLERWVRKLKEFLVRLLEALFGGSAAAPSGGSGAGLVAAVRVLAVLIAMAALVFGTLKLARRWRAGGQAEAGSEAREVLGEEIAENAAAADLFATATELARQGEHRAAIRRAYIALLCELEQRDKLRLRRSKTNRDYLEALRPEQRIFPTFSIMTDSFERVWYGRERAAEKEFNDFAALYREVVK